LFWKKSAGVATCAFLVAREQRGVSQERRPPATAGRPFAKTAKGRHPDMPHTGDPRLNGLGEGGADGSFGRSAVGCRRQRLGEDGIQGRGGGEIEHVLERVGIFIAQG